MRATKGGMTTSPERVFDSTKAYLDAMSLREAQSNEVLQNIDENNRQAKPEYRLSEEMIEKIKAIHKQLLLAIQAERVAFLSHIQSERNTRGVRLH